MNKMTICEFQIHKLNEKREIAATYSSVTADKLEKGGTIYIEMLVSMSESLKMKDELIENSDQTFLIEFDGSNQNEIKRFKGVISKCYINPFNCERTSFEAEIKICSELE